MGQPVVRLSEAYERPNGRHASELEFEYEGNGVGTSTLGVRRSSYRDYYRILGGRQFSGTLEARWAPAGTNRFEVHGQLIAAFEGNRRVAELEVTSDGPSTIRLVASGNERPYPQIRVAGGAGGVSINVRRSQFQLVERSVGREDLGWMSWQNIVHLNYLLDVPQTAAGRKNLVVVFSSLGREYDFTYNYRSALQGSDSYRLFLLDDFGMRGSYYFSNHRDLTIHREVQKFLTEIIEKLGVAMDRVTFAGSSKGGTGALIHGVGLGVGKIIVGAPQVFPGSYLQDSAPAVLEFIAGGRDSGAKKWLDNAVVSRISRPPAETSVRILVGEKDHHWKRHIRPLLELVDSHDSDFQALTLPDLTHSDIGSVYRHYLRNVVDQKPRSRTEDVLPHVIENVEGNLLRIKVWKPKGELISCHLYQGSKLVGKKAYSKREEFTFSVVPGDEVRFRIFRRCPGENRPFAWFYSKSISV
ncbi:hypothetical protein MUG94_11365 [Arthrobacter gengyunqii]|uniref:Uncharacterized protein n=1 Tax=Arthrobacter gengyunqii TaxID=2886940 RepID=A0A9X1M2X1_9MICC|nr:hypothetical protein [Arthrobacter gengyunqii]MCC3269915.1 hypothetical protein [Arthrobacter gengyunqii]UOY95154.1 hypothetical protein MUG94_11365 [Arthrobacter gengyunqii]